MPLSRYDYLNRKTIVVHDEQRRELSEAALTELERFQVFELNNDSQRILLAFGLGAAFLCFVFAVLAASLVFS